MVKTSWECILEVGSQGILIKGIRSFVTPTSTWERTGRCQIYQDFCVLFYAAHRFEATSDASRREDDAAVFKKMPCGQCWKNWEVEIRTWGAGVANTWSISTILFFKQKNESLERLSPWKKNRCEVAWVDKLKAYQRPFVVYRLSPSHGAPRSIGAFPNTYAPSNNHGTEHDPSGD